MSNLPVHAATVLLMFGVLPIWIFAGFIDYFCHRASHIDSTSGPAEAAMHLFQFGLIAVPTVLALLFEINASFFLIAVVAIMLHHGVAYIDVRYANQTRKVSPFEQMVHSFLEILPITAFLLLAVLHWSQFLVLAGGPAQTHSLGFYFKPYPLPIWYVVVAMAAAGLFNTVPYLEELARCLQAARARRH